MSPCLETDILQIQSIPCWGHSYLHCRGVSFAHDCRFGDFLMYIFWASVVALEVKNLPVNAGDIRDIGLIPRSGRSSGRRNGNPLQYSCLENPMDRGSWWAKVYRVSKSRTRMKQLSTHMMCTFQDSPVAKDCSEPTCKVSLNWNSEVIFDGPRKKSLHHQYGCMIKYPSKQGHSLHKQYFLQCSDKNL